MKRNVSVVRFKFRCNILISGKIIKEMPGSVASGTSYIIIALLILHAMRMRHIICGLAGSIIFFPHYLINGTILRNKVTEHKMCVLIFSTTS